MPNHRLHYYLGNIHVRIKHDTLHACLPNIVRSVNKVTSAIKYETRQQTNDTLTIFSITRQQSSTTSTTVTAAATNGTVLDGCLVCASGARLQVEHRVTTATTIIAAVVFGGGKDRGGVDPIHALQREIQKRRD